MMGRASALLFGLALVTAAVSSACSAAEVPPSKGTYTIEFPSTAAAVATTTVQLQVFDVPSDRAERSRFCEVLIQGRKTGEQRRKPLLETAPVDICDMQQGSSTVTIPYGEKAVLAIAQRDAVDFMLGCVIGTFGNGDAPLPIPVALVDVSLPVPPTSCTTISTYCNPGC